MSKLYAEREFWVNKEFARIKTLSKSKRQAALSSILDDLAVNWPNTALADPTICRLLTTAQLVRVLIKGAHTGVRYPHVRRRCNRRLIDLLLLEDLEVYSLLAIEYWLNDRLTVGQSLLLMHKLSRFPEVCRIRDNVYRDYANCIS